MAPRVPPRGHEADVEFVFHPPFHFLLILAQSDRCNFEVWGAVSSVTSAVVCPLPVPGQRPTATAARWPVCAAPAVRNRRSWGRLISSFASFPCESHASHLVADLQLPWSPVAECAARSYPLSHTPPGSGMSSLLSGDVAVEGARAHGAGPWQVRQRGPRQCPWCSAW